MKPVDRPLLVGDIGGTHARFAWVSHPGAEPQDVSQYRCAAFTTLQDAVAQYAADLGQPAFDGAALGIATAVTGDRVAMTNHHWAFSQRALQQELGWKRLLVLNDFKALALSLPTLGPDDRAEIGPPRKAQEGAPIALIGAGTGLGMSGLLPTAAGLWTAVSGEGGHATVAPNSALEFAIVEILRREFGHVSAERVLSGPGLVNLYRACCIARGTVAEDLQPPQVLSRGECVADPDIDCHTALDLFCTFMGGAAANLALSLGATGGVYIGGGIAPRLLERLRSPSFREAFENKGRFSSYLADIPIWVITAKESPALRGASQALVL